MKHVLNPGDTFGRLTVVREVQKVAADGRRYRAALAKLTSAKVRELRARRADGLTYRQLAAEFGISDVSACAAVNRQTWAHVS